MLPPPVMSTSGVRTANSRNSSELGRCTLNCVPSTTQFAIDNELPPGLKGKGGYYGFLSAGFTLMNSLSHFELSRESRPSARKGLVQKLDVRDQIGLHPSPVGQPRAAGSTDLIGKKLDRPFVNPVIVRFDNPFLVPIDKPKQTSCSIAVQSS